MNLKLSGDKLYSIFYSGFSGPPDWLVLDEVAFCLENNILLLKKEPLKFKKEEFQRLIEKIKVIDGLGGNQCGTTDPSAVLLYFENKEVKKVSILPYLFAEENKFVLYSFLRAKNFEKFQKIKKENLKNVFLKAKEKSIRI